MGNQLLKGYALQGEPISSVGCEKMWRIYQGQKQSTNTSATIFAIQKRALAKSQREQLIQFAKRQAMGLARIRHPGVLAISETLIEDEHILAFSTEQILGNLTMLSRDNKLKQIISNQIELRLNLFPLLDTLQFLHDNVKTVHLGINFDNIYITKEGKWKISGFSNSQIHGGQGLEDLKNFRCSNFYFCSPQVVTQKKFQKKSDVYSFGILVLDLLLILVGKYELKSYKSQSEYKESFEKDLLKKINNESLQKLENYRQLKTLLKNVFARQPQKRASLHELSSSKWLNDKLVLTVRYLQNITNYDNKQQIEFLKGLMGILNHFQSRILLRKVLPLLLDLLKFKHLIPSVVYICLQIMKNGKIISQKDFKQRVWPSLRKVVQGKQMTAHSLYLFVQNIQKIEKVVGMQELTTCILPLYVKCFDCPPKLKQLALVKTDYMLGKMDYQFVKTKMIPKIMACIKDQNNDIHKKSLIALRKSIKILDTQTITSIVLPGLEASRKSGSDPFINAITVSIYAMLGKTLPSQALCSKLIPTVLPYLSDPNVGPQDFYQYKNAMMTMIEKIESQRKKFWDESQIAQGPTYTEKDFEFEDESRKNAAVQSNIGKGDYNFLSNYNNNKNQHQAARNEQSNPSLDTHLRKEPSNDNLDFSSPFNFDDAIKSHTSQNQYQTPQVKSYNMNITSNPTMINANSYTGISNPATKTSQYQSSIGLGGDFGMGNFDTGNQAKSPPTTQPVYQQNRQIPKLKGPGESSASKPKNDPWASISISETSGMNFGNDFSMGGNQNTNTFNNINTNYTASINTNIGGGFSNFGMGGNFGSVGDDPFAEIQKNSYGNTNINTGGLNVNMNTNTNSSQFSYGNTWQNTNNTNFNINMNTNKGATNNDQGMMGFGYGNTGINNLYSNNTNNNNAFSFDMGMNIGSTPQQNSSSKGNSSSEFDLI